jgi:hypothetical protein
MRGLFSSFLTMRRLGAQAAAIGALTLASSVLMLEDERRATPPQESKAVFTSKWPVKTPAAAASAAAEGARSPPEAASAPPPKVPAVSDRERANRNAGGARDMRCKGEQQRGTGSASSACA